MTAPALNNSWTRVAMRRIRSFPPEERQQVLDRIDRATQDAIARLRSDDWLPIAAGVEVCDALYVTLGAKRAVAFWSELVHDSWVGGLLKPLVSTMSEGPLGLLQLAPAAWSVSARDCGEVVVVGDGAGRLRLEARGLPRSVRDSLGIQAMYAGALEAMLAFSKLRAEIQIDAEGDGPLAFGLQFEG